MTVGGELTQMLRFADNIALVPKNEKEIESVLIDMQRSFEKYDLKINWKKPKVMLCQKTQQEHRLQI